MSKNDSISPLLRYMISAASIVIIIAGMKLAASIANLILMSLLLAFSISPVQKWLIQKHLPKGLAVLITVLIVVIGGSGLFSILAVSTAGLIDKLPSYETSLTTFWQNLNSLLGNYSVDLSKLLSLQQFEPKQMVKIAGDLLGVILQGLSNGLLVVIIVVFVLIEMAGMQIRQVKGDKIKSGFQDTFDQAVEDVGKYISITGWIGFLNAIANYILLLVLGIDFALTWAVLSFLFNFIPNIGIIMAILAPAIIALLQYGWIRALLIVIGYILFNFIFENVLKPRTMKAGLDIAPLITILSVIFWSWVLGAAGTILAVPLTITLQKLVLEQAEKGI